MEKNITKREIATLQVVNHAKGQTQVMPTVQRFVVAGDFNTNLDQPEFAKEQTLLHLEEAGFQNAFGKLGAKQRVTHPGEGKFPDATFDYVFVSRGCTAGIPKITKSDLSDHYPVTSDVTLKP